MEQGKHRPIRPMHHSMADEEWARLPGWKKLCARRFFSRIALKKEQRKGWKYPLRFYLFWCDRCGNPAKDYERGFHNSTNRGDLVCSYCGAVVSFIPPGVMPIFAGAALSVAEWFGKKTARLFKKEHIPTPGAEIKQDP